MDARKALPFVQSLPVRGAIVGFCATQALDLLSTYLYEHEDRSTRAAEDAVRGGLHAYERAVMEIARACGVSLSRREAKLWGWRGHKAMGLLGGLGYVAARQRAPTIGRWGGLAFGTGFFAIVDEVLVPLLGLTPGPQKFSWKVHARGAVSHLLYGVVAEATTRALEQSAARIRVRKVEPKKAVAAAVVAAKNTRAVTVEMPDMDRLA